MVSTTHFTQQGMSIGADLARLGEIRRFAERMAASFGFDAALQQQIKLAINEAAANAVEHGSASPHDVVELRAVDEDGALTFYIVDSGRFVPPSAPRGHLPERGRGMAFMELLMDEVHVRPSDRGTTVRLAKRLAG